MVPTTRPPSIAKAASQEVRRLSLPVIAIGAILAMLYFGRVFLITAMTAVTIAFILDPFVTVLMRLRLPRSVASFVVCTAALLFLYVIGMGAYSQLTGLYGDLPKYGQRIADIVDGVQQKIQGMESDTYRMLVPTRQRLEEEERQKQEAKKSRSSRAQAAAAAVTPVPLPAPPPAGSAVSDYLAAHLSSFYQILLMASFIPFLVYFMLSWRDHLRRSFLYLFSGADRQVAHKTWESIAEATRAYVIGNFMLGLILTVLSSSFFLAIHMPYWLLVGVLSGFFSLVPYVGLPLAILPAFAAGLTVYNGAPIYLLIAVVVAGLHLLAVNLLYPKVVGARLHLNPLVVTVALMFWGTLWGAIGLILGVPIVAAVKAACDHISGLEAYGKFLGD